MEQIGRAVETEAGTVVLSKDELTALDADAEQTIEVQRFVPADQVDPVMHDKVYYLGPDKLGAKAYALLATAMGEGNHVAVTRLTMRGRTRLATLRSADGVLVVTTLHWPDEVRTPDVGIKAVELWESEVDVAGQLIAAMTGDFKPDEYVNVRRDKVLELVASRDAVPVKTAPAPQTNVYDLMAQLKASVAQHTAA